MSEDIDGIDWDPPELVDSGAPEVYIAGPGWIQQYVRTASVVIAAIAVSLGVLTMADESMKQTDLQQQQADLLRQQLVYNDCKDQLLAISAFGTFNATAIGSDADSFGFSEEARSILAETLGEGILTCFPDDGIFGD